MSGDPQRERLEVFKAVADVKWDQYIRANTTFVTWQDMLTKAVEQWTTRQLGF